MKKRFNCTRMNRKKGLIHPILQIVLLQKNSWPVKELNKFYPPNSSDDLCLLFCIYPSSMQQIKIFKKLVEHIKCCFICLFLDLSFKFKITQFAKQQQTFFKARCVLTLSFCTQSARQMDKGHLWFKMVLQKKICKARCALTCSFWTQSARQMVSRLSGRCLWLIS